MLEIISYKTKSLALLNLKKKKTVNLAVLVSQGKIIIIKVYYYQETFLEI